jgi:hypothetical protein
MTSMSECESSRDRFPVGRFTSVMEVNARNQEFWDQQSSLRDERMANPVTFQTAMEDLEAERLRQVPVYFQKPLEKALEDAARTGERLYEQSKVQFHTEFSRKGGKAPKHDVLQQFILSRVRTRPRMTESELLGLLKENRRVFNINEEEISFDKPNGAEKSVPISALKDRLSRAKKKINSR